jgi:hypothetical protein
MNAETLITIVITLGLIYGYGYCSSLWHELKRQDREARKYE